MAKLIKKIRTEDGDLQIDYTALANLPKSDTTLSSSGAFADAKTTGDKLKETNTRIDNLTDGTTTAPALNATDLKAKTFSLNGSSIKSYDLTMGSVASGKVLSPKGAINLAHSHAVIVNDDGTITLGEVSATGGNFKIADTKAYKDGVSAAKDSVTLSKSWSSGTITVKASNGKTSTATLSKGSESWSSNMCSFSIMDDGTSTGLTCSVDASSRYTAGSNAVTLSKSWDDGVVTVKASNGKESTATLSKGTETWSGNTCAFPVMDGSTSTGLTCSVDASARYNAGQNSVTVPSANIVRNTGDTYNSSDYSTTVTIKATASNNKSGTQTFTVSGKSAYDAGYNAGSAGGSGASSVTLTKSWSGGILTVKASNGKTSTATLGKGTETWDENTCSVPITDGGSSTGFTCSVDASQVYTNGQNSVIVPNANIVRQSADYYVGGDNHSTTVYIKATASNGAYGIQSFSVSGTSAYNAGHTSGLNSDDFDKFSVSGGTISISLLNGKTTSISVGAGEVDGSTTEIPVYATGDKLDHTLFTIDASNIYTSGQNSVTVPSANIVRQAADSYAGGDDHSTTVYIKATASNGAYGTQSFTVSGKSAYNAGHSAGLQSDDFDKFSASGGDISISLLNGKTTTISIYGDLDDSTNKVSIGATGVKMDHSLFEIDASSVYTKGYTAGANGIKLTKSWSSGILTVQADNTAKTTSTAQLSKGEESWSGDTCTFAILDGGGSTGYTCTVDAYARYRAGWNACRNRMTAVSCLITSTSNSDLYYSNGQRATGTWYQGTAATYYSKPAAI